MNAKRSHARFFKPVLESSSLSIPTYSVNVQMRNGKSQMENLQLVIGHFSFVTGKRQAGMPALSGHGG
jgi:hypothetical protein